MTWTLVFQIGVLMMLATVCLVALKGGRRW